MITDIDFNKYGIVDEKTPIECMLTGHYKRSYAFYTLSHRLPVIVTNLIDIFTREKEDIFKRFGEEGKEDLKAVVGSLSKLKYELQTDKVMSEISGNDSDQATWNELLQSLTSSNTSGYFSAPWLYSECYVYRRIKSIFAATSTMKDFDYFTYHKVAELENSLEAISSVVESINEFKKSEPSDQQVEDFFCKLLKVNLWGNKNDLSITLGQEISGGKRDPIAETDKFNEFLLVDNTKEIWNCLKSNDRKFVDFVNDNAGYELLCDLVLAEFMLHFKIASRIRFRLKSIPWFISDALPHDFHETLDKLKSSKCGILSEFGTQLGLLTENGNLSIINPPDLFFTGPLEYSKMEEKDHELWSKLKEVDLVIFKGDLNYRKLLCDKNWIPSTSFETSLCGFKPTNLCAMRTVKADLISGIDQQVADRLDKEHDGKSWMATGQYGVIQFVNK